MTPGQAAYEALHASIARRQPGHLWVAWYAVSEINDGIPGEPLREDLEAAAQAVIGHAADELATLREALEATLADWRDDAAYRVTDTRDEMNEHCGVTACADTLAGILAALQTPGTQPGQQETNQEGTK